MRTLAVQLEEQRLRGLEDLDQYPRVKDRHRVFPAVFEGRHHRRILDLSAGVGVVARRIRDLCPEAELVCNDIAPTCARLLEKLGLETHSFDLDDGSRRPYPFADGSFDAVLSLVTIEHLYDIDHFMREAHRLLADGGWLYISAPNYAAPEYLLPFLATGRSFHDPARTFADPLATEESRYEFYTHIRYFTYRTLLEYVGSFGFTANSVYIALPEAGARYRALYRKAPWAARAYRGLMWLRHHLLSPRWATEPILCCRKGDGGGRRKPRKVVL